MTTPTDAPLLLAVDAPSLLHRAHHARVASDQRDRGGRPAWALHGMLLQVLEAVERFAPDRVVLGFDDRTHSQRAARYPAYKAGRAQKHPELLEQIDRGAAMLDAMGLHTVTPAGLEADDVTASAATWARRHGWQCIVITSDRDAFAHISDSTRVLRLINGGVGASPLLDPAKLFTMYGVEAGHYLDFAALRGDASDNLPGVAGIGEKAAALLLEAAGSMRAVWADVEHAGGATLVAALDSLSVERTGRRMGAGVLRKLAADGAREQFEFNRSMMAGRDDLDLGLVPDVSRSTGALPLDELAVARVTGHLGVSTTTVLALRVLTGTTPASRMALLHGTVA
ncbi:5'-3' exonuclease H3TH domain-containing protein [Nocardioides sp. CFH 31398]|uniref:5'-3' exonuclease n=1 Tax=Nocardioides sp. CFH 31398 TaxID=2919579 RepID=UPI001F0709BB|nr:5'-3' exonuclease H3TH domain-containing protein [Nocardioides sp. CFH 31398]MCH1865397.1 5'-3' exonuclease [Nocardioides sp. CFH 31398]